jgi:hypothetical protein
MILSPAEVLPRAEYGTNGVAGGEQVRKPVHCRGKRIGLQGSTRQGSVNFTRKGYRDGRASSRARIPAVKCLPVAVSSVECSNAAKPSATCARISENW